jgi:hypothetical protein
VYCLCLCLVDAVDLSFVLSLCNDIIFMCDGLCLCLLSIYISVFVSLSLFCACLFFVLLFVFVSTFGNPFSLCLFVCSCLCMAYLCFVSVCVCSLSCRVCVLSVYVLCLVCRRKEDDERDQKDANQRAEESEKCITLFSLIEAYTIAVVLSLKPEYNVQTSPST